VTFWSAELLVHRYQHRRPVLAGVFSPLFFLPQIISTALVCLGTEGHISFDTLTEAELKTELRPHFGTLLRAANSTLVDRNTILYRARVNPHSLAVDTDFDSPPVAAKSEGRFNRSGFPALYAAFDPDTCLYECRAEAGNDFFLATLNVAIDQPVLDLNQLLGDPGEDLVGMAYYLLARLTSKAEEDYQVLQYFAEFAKEQSVWGIRYPSYYRSVNNIKGFNVVLFGQPIGEGRVTVESINRVRLKSVLFDYCFGPVPQELWKPTV
jgi:hypothetical protein